MIKGFLCLLIKNLVKKTPIFPWEFVYDLINYFLKKKNKFPNGKYGLNEFKSNILK